MMYAVYAVGPQGVLIDMDHRDNDLEMIQWHIENCNYSFQPGVEYVCLPYFEGRRETND